MFALIRLRADPHYRIDAFRKGLARAGWEVVERDRWPSSPDDLLVIWNRQQQHEAEADAWEKRGGTVIVAENGYLGKDAEGRQFYAIAVHGHNGSGWFPMGDEDRFAALGVEVKPWSERDGSVLVCGQRGIGSRTMASPSQWEFQTARKLAGAKIPHRVRRHPGRFAPKVPLADDLRDTSVCAIWSSSSGVQALVAGIPVSYFAPHWICEAGAGRGFEGIKTPVRDDAARAAALQRMAWGQRSVAEIESGEPFVRIREHRGEASW